MDTSEYMRQGKYEDYINAGSRQARERGSRPPYHLIYAKKMKEMQEKKKGGDNDQTGV